MSNLDLCDPETVQQTDMLVDAVLLVADLQQVPPRQRLIPAVRHIATFAFDASETYALPGPSLTKSMVSPEAWINDSSSTRDNHLSTTWV